MLQVWWWLLFLTPWWSFVYLSPPGRAPSETNVCLRHLPDGNISRGNTCEVQRNNRYTRRLERLQLSFPESVRLEQDVEVTVDIPALKEMPISLPWDFLFIVSSY